MKKKPVKVAPVKKKPIKKRISPASELRDKINKIDIRLLSIGQQAILNSERFEQQNKMLEKLTHAASLPRVSEPPAEKIRLLQLLAIVPIQQGYIENLQAILSGIRVSQNKNELEIEKLQTLLRNQP